MTDTSREAIEARCFSLRDGPSMRSAEAAADLIEALAAERDALVAANQAAANDWIEHQAHLCDLLCAIHGGHSYTAHHGLERSMVEAKTIVEKAIAAKETAERDQGEARAQFRTLLQHANDADDSFHGTLTTQFVRQFCQGALRAMGDGK